MRSFINTSFAVLPLLASLFGCSSRPHFDRLPDVGQPVPAFDLPALDGTRMTSASLAGKPTLIALWSSDCGASRQALQAVASIEKDYASRGVRVLVLADDGDVKQLRAVMDAAKVKLAVAYASGSLDDIFDADRHLWEKTFALPSFLILDEKGRVAAKDFGVPLEEAQKSAIRLQSVRDSLDRVRPKRVE